MIFEKGGGVFVQDSQTVVCSDIVGMPHILHDGPLNFSIVFQQQEQIGLYMCESEKLPHEGQRDGNNRLSNLLRGII